jgi:transposase
MKHEELSFASESLRRPPPMRAERVQEVRERLRAGLYETKAVREELAYRLSALPGLLRGDPTALHPRVEPPAKNR